MIDRSLAAFQRGFAAALADPSIAAEALPADVARLVAQPGFAVYRNTTLAGCIDALAANYPAVARIVGDEWFRACAAVFVRADWPAHAPLVDYGAGFPAFLARFPPAEALCYLPGVARLDRCFTEAHLARDALPVDAGEAARAAVVAPHPSARWAWFEDAPIHTIWRRNRAAGDYDDRPIDWRGEGALIVRPHDAVVDFAIDGAACALLDALAAGAGREAALARVDDAGHDAASAFAFLVDAQALTIPAGAACAIR